MPKGATHFFPFTEKERKTIKKIMIDKDMSVKALIKNISETFGYISAVSVSRALNEKNISLHTRYLICTYLNLSEMTFPENLKEKISLNFQQYIQKSYE